MPQPPKKTTLTLAEVPTLPQVDAALTRARTALLVGCEQGDLDGVRLTLEVLDHLLDTRSEVSAGVLG